jgi:hypothetical protein
MSVSPLTVPCDGDDGCGAGVGEPCVTWHVVEAAPGEDVRCRRWRAVPCDAHPERAARETRLRALGAAYFTQQITADELAGEVVRLVVILAYRVERFLAGGEGPG